MKSLFAATLLLFQLQPLIGSAACALFSRSSEQTCEMPERRPVTPASELQSGAASQGCALGFVCARTTIAAPSFTGGEESTTPLHLTAAPAPAGTLTGIAPAPPFHPPNV